VPKLNPKTASVFTKSILPISGLHLLNFPARFVVSGMSFAALVSLFAVDSLLPPAEQHFQHIFVTTTPYLRTPDPWS